ncbi:MAG: hypothetical protein R3C68_17965 [Myxococcota bacterium]
MRNILFALAIGLIVFAALYVPGVLSLGESIVPGIFVMLLAYYVLARRTFKRVEKIFNASAQALQAMPPRFDLAVATLQGAYALASTQIGIRTQVDSQIGMLYFLQKEFSKALPHLKRALGFGHWLGAAMLAVIYYKKKNYDELRKTLEIVTKRGKKESMAWNLSAYLFCQLGERDEAQRVLIEGIKKTNDNPKIRENLLALQNGKKIKMRSYKEQWYQLHLERPPAQYQQAALRPKLSRTARRGRW